MVKREPALVRLRALAAAAASGELICAGDAIEVHVYLQRGRIAWATDSSHPFAFASHLQEAAQIDTETFRQVVEECRRERLPLGETIVEWGLASWDAVRASLAHQIALALAILAAAAGAQTLFLERAYAYSERLTFALDDVLAPGVESPPEPPAVAATPGVSARQLRTAIDGLSWVEAHGPDEVVDAEPRDVRHVPDALVRATLRDGATFAAIRGPRSSIVGVTTPARTVWVGLSHDVMFGIAVSELLAALGVSDPARERIAPRTSSAPWTIGAAGELAAMAAFYERAVDVLAAIALRDAEPVAAIGGDRLSRARATDLAARRLPALGHAVALADAGLSSLGLARQTMVSAERDVWCFGAALGRGDSLWLFVDRRNAQGLGWAYLTALARAVERASGGSP